MSWLQKMWKSSYVRMLEEENARLRAENRAFLNSLLATVGFPPVEPADTGKPVAMNRVRKRSWPQIQRMREDETAK
ncbi:MAG: hypothetical protein WBR26_03275 [Candidatus Acidiferrum sp.]